MSETIHIMIPGPVAPFQKKTATWHSKDGQRSGTLAYNAGSYAKWKDYARMVAAQAVGDRIPFQGPVEVEIRIYREIPASISKRNRERALAGTLRPITTPDLDNNMKAIADSVLTGVVIRDDKFIVSAQLGKWYSDKPRVEIVVTEWLAAHVMTLTQDSLFHAPKGE